MSLFGKLVFKDEHRGFTLLEGIIALVVVGLITSSLSWLRPLEAQLKREEAITSSNDWHLFLSQLENSLADWDYVSVSADQQRVNLIDRQDENSPFEILFLKQANKETGVMIKRKRGGYEPILMQVKAAQFSASSNYVSLVVRLGDGKTYEAKIYQWSKEE